MEISQKADAIGSTEGIIKTIAESPQGSKWAVGTELNLVNRMAREMAPEREVVSLDDCFCVCSTMFRIDPPHLLWALEGLLRGQVRNQVKVPPRIAEGARTALSVLSGLSVADLAHTVALQDAGPLTRIPGIGKKTAERLLLELKGKLAEASAPAGGQPASDVVNALVALGYSDKEALVAVKGLAPGLPVAEAIRAALKALAKQ